MRELLYKAKLKNKDRWIEGFYCCRKETTYCFKEDYEKFPVKTLYYIICDEMTDWGLPNEFRLYEVDPTTLCQFTGHYDKNGNKIYENDIVKTQYGRLCKVIWFTSDSHCGFDLEPICATENLKLKPPSECFLWNKEALEVVGNVFDNPELLE